MVVQRHKQSIDDDTQRDEQLDERVKDDQGDVLLELQPEPTAVPHTEHVYCLHEALDEFLFERGSILILFRCWEVVH